MQVAAPLRKPREVASGIDALYLSGRAVIRDRWLAELGGLREAAGESGEAKPVVLGGVEFRLQPHAFGKYRYCLDHRHGRIGVTESGRLPALRVQPRAEFLHGVGPLAAAAWFDEVLGSICSAIRWGVSRLDIFADWQGWQLNGEDRHRFVCRADSVAVHEEHRVLTGLEFGRRTSKTLCARIYDKTAESAHSGAGFWPEIWGEKWTRDQAVLRVEFEFGREGLRQFGIDTPAEAVDAAGSLWSYATASWLTLREVGTDDTRSRWIVAQEWETIGRASVTCGSFGIERMYEGRRSGTLRRITPGLLGYLASYAAVAGTEDIDDTLEDLAPYIRAMQRGERKSFADRVSAKVRELGWR